ncbi:MAG: metal-sulfur cluster assembly factor [Lentimicrobiaceae bacterium]|jgi:metal-sulfur cluster biosynthetic enzyme|nr:metal-sulfur cluster assembly factor [Lentimicrobiaceae bacterium]MBT3453644.1 metal-sulfur cluster assembly factor [Lentimicrobiaceae bacterium]MBT3817746.1 metal-sulfur cluster assembly factor [Lentimicrobiaceae bacterium]MBT4061072.1 metal-sulfur cluster assembly factor [Lentimicrobiaceae bacterium]MBT4191009.1 metal-sulfur cluster assembly factor [Lentimicrobiaceae bacterium]
MNLNNLTHEESNILELLKTVMDPEVAVNVVDLGLIYEVHHNPDSKNIHVLSTLSTRGCPLGDTIMENIRVVIANKYPEYNVDVELTWEPEWNPDMITREGRIAID